jgi:hypothetical protein
MPSSCIFSRNKSGKSLLQIKDAVEYGPVLKRTCDVLATYLQGSCYVLASYGDVANTYQPPHNHTANIPQLTGHGH